MLLTAPAQPGDVTTYHQYLQDLLAGQQATTAAAQQRQQEVVEARLSKAPANPTFFEVGTLVLVLPQRVANAETRCTVVGSICGGPTHP